MAKQKSKRNLKKNQTDSAKLLSEEIKQLIVRREQIRAEYEKFIKEQNAESRDDNVD